MLVTGTTFLPHPDPLPLGEGTVIAALGIAHGLRANPAARFAVKPDTILPLRAGEGRGEGKELIDLRGLIPLKTSKGQFKKQFYEHFA